MHALHGNGRGGRDSGGSGGGGSGRPGQAAAWQSAGRSQKARELMEPQTADRLRASGWRLPEEVSSDYVFRVYDTRLDPTWFRRLLPDLALDGDVYVIGGDFLTRPHLEDVAAMNTHRVARWGPAGPAPYHLVVPPRPHVASWLERARLQLPLEALGSWVTVSAIVPRELCPPVWSTSAVLRALPHLQPLLNDPTLEVRLTALGERPSLVRIPADVQVLPPPRWEAALLARDRVLVFISFRRHGGQRPLPLLQWLRGPPPPVGRSDLEMLRLECVLPSATKASAGERWLRTAVRKAAGLVDPGSSPPLQLRQIQVAHGVVFALLGVPAASARGWLRCSGHDSLFIRPFWTPSTGDAVARSNFQLIWLKGHLEAAPRLWTALHDVPGFYGLLADGKDLAIRVSEEADRTSIQAQVHLVVGQTSVRTAEPGVRWWRLGPLTEAELWRVSDLITSLGLQQVRAELRLAKLGPFRNAVFFPARGQPSRTTLDDGSWSSSEARLTPAEPPPRRKPTTGAALTSQSTWGGPRPLVPSSTSPPAPIGQPGPSGLSWSPPPPASVDTPTVWSSLPTVGSLGVSAAPATSSRSVAFVEPLAAGPGGRDVSGSTRRRGGRPLTTSEDRRPSSNALAPENAFMTALLERLASMDQQLAQMRQELQEQYRVNAELRLRAERAEGRQQHQPYQAAPLPLPAFHYTPPRPTVDALVRPASTLSPAPPGGSTPPTDADAKRPCRRLPMERAGVEMEVDKDALPPLAPASSEATLSNDQ